MRLNNVGDFHIQGQEDFNTNGKLKKQQIYSGSLLSINKSHQPSGRPSGLEVVTGKLPLPLPSPRALDPAGLDRSRVHIIFAKAYKTPSDSLQKCNASFRTLFFSYAFGEITMQSAQREATEHNQATTDFSFVSIIFFLLLPRPLPVIAPLSK